MNPDSGATSLVVEVGWLPVADVDVQLLGELLPDPDRARAAEFTHADALRHFLTGRWLTRRMLHERGVSFDAEFERGAHGKPQVEGGPSFNLSHSHGVAVCAVASRRHVPVGIDVEAPWRDSDIDSIGNRFFSSGESEELQAMAPAARRQAFFELWTLKEALLKGTGKGLKTPLSEVVFARNGSWRLSSRLERVWRFEQWRLPTDHIVSLAVGAERYTVAEPTRIAFRRS